MGWAEGQDRGLVTVEERAAELARRAKAHMTAAGRPWRDDRDGYICESIARGSTARLPKASPKNDAALAEELKNGVGWGEDQTIDAELVRWLCADPAARPLIPHAGVHIVGARIIGTLELAFAEMPFPLALQRCDIEGAMSLRQARVPLVMLDGSRCRDINADGIDVKGDVFLRDGFHATGEVRLLGATIGGSLSFSGGTLQNPVSRALYGDGAMVKGSIFLSHGFCAIGEVRLLGASVGGYLICDGARLFNPRSMNDANAFALCLDRIDVTGNIFLGRGFRAIGGVRLAGALVGGQLSCGGGIFWNPRAKIAENAYSLNVEGMHIKHGVLLCDGFRAKGAVRLVGANLGGHLNCEGGSFKNPRAKNDAEACAINADGIVVEGGVYLRDGFRALGCVRFVAATIGVQLDASGGMFEHPRATHEAEACAFIADSLDVRGNVFLGDGFHASGAVRLIAARVGGRLECSGGTFEHPAADRDVTARALDLEHANIVDGLVTRTDGTGPCRFRGYVDLLGARLDTLQLLGTELFVGSTLDLRRAHAKAIEDERDAWPAAGKLLVEGFRYDAIADTAPNSAADRLEWLKRTPPDRFHTQPYTQLASVLRARGDRAGAVEVLIARERAALHHDTRRWARVLGWWRGFLMGYGYKPYKAAKFLVYWWIVSSLVFTVASRLDLMVPTARDATSATVALGERQWSPPEETLRPGYPEFWAAAYALDAMTPLLDLQQDRYYIPRSDTMWGSVVLFLLWVHIAAGWFLFTVFLAAVTGLVTPGDG